MPHIVIISASVREGRESHKVATYLQGFIENHTGASAGLIDLKAMQFPIFEERLMHLSNPLPQYVAFGNSIKACDGVIIVTPEYNGGYPAGLKNAVDLLVEEWKHKPLAIATVSDGDFGGTQVLTSLLFTFWKLRAILVTARFQMARVQDHFDEKGNPTEPEVLHRRTDSFVKELLWYIERFGKQPA